MYHLVKIKFKGQIAHSLQSISQRAERKAHLTGIGLSIDHDKKLLKRLESITSKEIQKAAKKYLEDPFLSIFGNKKIAYKSRSKC